MKLLRVTNIQRGCVYDGPGVRTTVFLKGCSLRCPWCCNPETISFEKQWFIDDKKCLYLHGNASKLCEQCERVHGQRSINECLFGVSEAVSRDYSEEELLNIILKDQKLYKESNGGVTFSGGEPLMQAESLVTLLHKLKEVGIHITFETTLVASEKSLDFVLPYANLFIIDLKLQPQMKLNDSLYIDWIQHRLSSLYDKNLLFRLVFVDDVYAHKEDILYALKKLNVTSIELLLCHNLGNKKYEKLSKQNQLFNADVTKAESFRCYLAKNGVDSSILSA